MNTFASHMSEENFRSQLQSALYESDKQKVVQLIESEKIEINEYLNASNPNFILMNAVKCSPLFRGSKEQIGIINYLIDLKADVNQKNKSGFTAIHVALSYHDLSEVALLLIRKGNPDVNIVDEKNGNSPIYIAIREYGLTWREEQKEVNQLRFEIIKELLFRNANLDQVNNHGISARKWIERVPLQDKLHKLIDKM